MNTLYCYSVEIKVDDEAVLGMLRSLAHHSQTTGNARIPWGGTGRENWKSADHHVTFRFSTPQYQVDFINLANKWLMNHWQLIEVASNNPRNEGGTDVQVS